MRRRIKRVVGALLLCALLCTAVFAEPSEEPPIPELQPIPVEKPQPIPVEKPQPESVEEPQPESVEEPQPEPTEEPSTDPIEEPPTESSTEPSVEPSIEPSVEPSADPSIEPSIEPSVEPSAEPSIEPSVEPTPEPTPEPQDELCITVTGSTQGEDGRWIVKYFMPQQPVEAQWNAVEGAVVYAVRVIAEEQTRYETETEETVLTLTVTDFLTENGKEKMDVLLIVEALAEDRTPLADGELPLEFVQESGRRKHGGHGGRRSGGGAQEEQGFHVTPGVALTNTHSSGDKSMNLYGSVEIALIDEPVSRMELDGEAITLDDGADFTATAEADTLTLAPTDDGRVWSFSGKFLKTLNRSGVNTLILNLNGQRTEIPTATEMRGTVYRKLSAQGIVSKDYAFFVNADGVEVFVQGERYRLSADHELLVIGG